MLTLTGWRSPGRGVHAKLHEQMQGIIKYLKDADKIGNDKWNPELQKKIGKKIGVSEASTLRHIIGFMKSIGVIYDDSLTGGKVPDTKHCVTKSGELLQSLINMEQIAIKNENEEVMERITNMYRWFYANAFLYWFVRDSKIHVARTVLKVIKQFGYLDKVEWFIVNTFISETDNKEEEKLVEQYISSFRSGEITLSTENIEKRINSYNYWTQLLSYAGLINKEQSKLYIGKQFPELIDLILADDFLENLTLSNRYYIEM